MSDGEGAICRCSRCGQQFMVLADEYGQHPCPRCGFHPGREEEEPEEEDDGD